MALSFPRVYLFVVVDVAPICGEAVVAIVVFIATVAAAAEDVQLLAHPGAVVTGVLFVPPLLCEIG